MVESKFEKIKKSLFGLWDSQEIAPHSKAKSSSKFLDIKCPRCGKTQVVFGKASTKVKCKDCNMLLIKTTGGKAKMKAPVKKVYGI
mgnify:CR=1 FL=1